ncbi:oligogalacturonide transport system substrate-binding protein [Enterococcus sp. AZ194]|uniref:ABC transporter substrate-binding protein n=1 Tax=Enterococcus sp. AZ194 TaxID=2774629 RepID=UPI003F207552
MRWVRKLGIIIGMGVGLSLLLSACSKPKEASDDSVTIRMSWWGNDERHKATLSAIKAFEKKYPNIKVKAEYGGFDGVEQKIATQMTGNTEPDLMQMNSGWLDLYSADGKGYYDLSKLDELDLSGYDESALKQGQVAGIQNSVPFCVNTWVWAVNKTTFDSLKLEIPTTWDGYIEAAKKFKDGSYPTQLSSSDLQIYLQQRTGKSFVSDDGKINYTQEELAEGLEWYQRMVDEKVTPKLQEIKEASAQAGSGTPSKEFLNGEWAGTTQWSATVGNDYLTLKDTGQELILSEYPKLSGDNKAYVLQTIMPFGISRNTKHPKEVAKLLNFLINDPEGVKAMGLTRGIPANKKAYEILVENKQIDTINQEVEKYTSTTDVMPKNKYLKMSRIQTAFEDNFESFAFGKTKADETAKKMLEEMQAAITQFDSTN